MTIIDAQVQPPMPATDCPDWCTTDHAAHWLDQTANLGRHYVIPQTDGSTYEGTITLESVLLTWTTFHHVNLATLQLAEGDEVATIDLQGGDDEATLYIDAQGALGPAQARAFAAALLEAADRFEALTAG